MSERRSISTPETAKLIRKALRESFHGVKTSVRSSSYAGGSSVRVSWTDGPTTAQVEAVAGAFCGGYFDGMIDYKGSLYHRLDGEPVHMGPDFVFCDRDHSIAAITRAIIRAVMQFGPYNVPTVSQFKNGDTFFTSPIGGWGQGDTHGSWQNIIRRTLEEREEWAEGLSGVEPGPSATLDRVTLEGSDGYGQCGIPKIGAENGTA